MMRNLQVAQAQEAVAQAVEAVHLPQAQAVLEVHQAQAQRAVRQVQVLQQCLISGERNKRRKYKYINNIFKLAIKSL